MPLLDFTQFGVPGAYILENTSGSIPAIVASFDTCYMLGYAALGPKAVPTFIESLADFQNVFGASSSQNMVRLFFDQRPGAGLWFVNVVPRKSQTVTVPTATSGAVYSITVDGMAVSYTAKASDTSALILAALSEAVNVSFPAKATLIGGILRSETASVVSASANVTLGTSSAAAGTPIVGDVIDCATRVFIDGLAQGYILAPEFYSVFSQADSAALAASLEAIAADPRVLMLHLVDCSPTAAQGNVPLLQAERASLTSPRGHMAYYAPWVRNLSNVAVPASAAVAGVAMRRYRQEGFRQAPAGYEYPLLGILGLTWEASDKAQKVLNPRGINLLRRKPGGFYIWGARTCSPSGFYSFVHTRVILNVLERTIQEALEGLIFQTIDGQGVLFSRVKGTCTSICERFRLAGALYGASPTDAYRVVCDDTNNPGIDLDQGTLAVDVYVKPSPTAEIIAIRVYRAAIGTSLTEETAFKADVNTPDGQTSGTTTGV